MGDSSGTKRVFIHKNEASAEGKVLHISDDISLPALKKLAAEKLGIKRVKKVFLANGMEVVSIDDIQQNENIYFSTGDVFYRSSAAGGAGTEKMNVSVLGGGGVGKSAITLRFVRDFFIKNWEATIEDAYRKTIRVDDEVSVLEILDTAGQEDFSTLRAQWMMDKDGYIFVYSLVDRSSLDQLYSFIDLLEQVSEGRSQIPPIIFLGNKKDLTDRDPDAKAVTADDVDRLMRACALASERVRLDDASEAIQANATWSMLHFETSALSGEKIDEIFEVMVREIRKRRQPTEKKKKSW
eukprot:CAMPEP_0185026152 /NCGR_PEP_ID=MMETSP1103-20130426/10123_1 /TAXON_ID=36769 /ORGANISM="Paraphysomonas bandaiensis, Strain Caron Lab Isolate" /LENGTH=295 /DNA_ID=CAMNT_0027559641 /DNA_START=56 /DNA_END=940 /DNA_ORIENTATION=-